MLIPIFITIGGVVFQMCGKMCGVSDLLHPISAAVGDSEARLGMDTYVNRHSVFQKVLRVVEPLSSWAERVEFSWRKKHTETSEKRGGRSEHQFWSCS